jgi:glutamine amidotransferase
MNELDVVVVRTGTANLASVCVGLERAGARPRIVDKRADIEKAERLVLPGVGTLAAAMDTIKREGMAEPLRERIEEGLPTMAICLGMQLMCDTSEESEGQRGLEAVRGNIKRLPSGQRIPQMGWNLVKPTGDATLLKQGYAYFANSYCLQEIPIGWAGAVADYGGQFVAAIERGRVLACQFHPELSSNYGQDLIRRWLNAGEEEN